MINNWLLNIIYLFIKRLYVINTSPVLKSCSDNKKWTYIDEFSIIIIANYFFHKWTNLITKLFVNLRNAVTPITDRIVREFLNFNPDCAASNERETQQCRVADFFWPIHYVTRIVVVSVKIIIKIWPKHDVCVCVFVEGTTPHTTQMVAWIKRYGKLFITSHYYCL